ncbi:unnamed protein product [Thelazia callipaeda]|uniref:Peptidase_M14 domain-containing protein n=1 Tax=Thelazia callipaeda TaxID=103827 RepID=A0A158RAL1_THECL|nr:unnamed protein product [Thelazia callipaeda]
MVEEMLLDKFLTSLLKHNISYTIMIKDVEKKIIKLQESAQSRPKSHWLRDEPFLRRQVYLNLAKYHSYDRIINYLSKLSEVFADRARAISIGTTHEGRKIALIKIGKPAKFQKPGIWIDGGIHAREWISPAAVLYMISQLVTKYDSDPQIRRFVDEMDWYIVPLLNPDGYEYSRSSTHPEVRLWRKNRSPSICQFSRHGHFSIPQRRCCQGVDLNRNYDWQFGAEGSSKNPCSEVYQGPYAFSEPETRAVHDFIAKRRHKVKTFLTFHSYSQILMYPYGHRVRTYTSDVGDLRNTALQAANALRAAYGTIYSVGTGADTLYPASGGAEDWAKGRMGVKYSYLFELRPEEQVWDGFLLDESQVTIKESKIFKDFDTFINFVYQILPTSRETFEAVKVIADHTLKMFSSQSLTTVQTKDSITGV